MGSKPFLIEGNICGDRVRLARALQNPPIKQKELAARVQLLGMDMTEVIVSRIETNQRHVVDGELRMLAKALGVTMEWLCGDSDEIKIQKRHL